MAIEWNETFYRRVESLAFQGMGTKDIYQALGISKATYHRKMKDEGNSEKFKTAEVEGLSKGVGVATSKYKDLMVGAKVDAEKIFIGKNGAVIRVDTYKCFKPDIRALQMYLLNFGGWKDKKQIELLNKDLEGLGGLSGALKAIEELTRDRESESGTPTVPE